MNWTWILFRSSAAGGRCDANRTANKRTAIKEPVWKWAKVETGRTCSVGGRCQCRQEVGTPAEPPADPARRSQRSHDLLLSWRSPEAQLLPVPGPLLWSQLGSGSRRTSRRRMSRRKTPAPGGRRWDDLPGDLEPAAPPFDNQRLSVARVPIKPLKGFI